MGLFNFVAQADENEVDVAQLAASTGADALLISEYPMHLLVNPHQFKTS